METTVFSNFNYHTIVLKPLFLKYNSHILPKNRLKITRLSPITSTAEQWLQGQIFRGQIIKNMMAKTQLQETAEVHALFYFPSSSSRRTTARNSARAAGRERRVSEVNTWRNAWYDECGSTPTLSDTTCTSSMDHSHVDHQNLKLLLSCQHRFTRNFWFWHEAHVTTSFSRFPKLSRRSGIPFLPGQGGRMGLFIMT